jgi:tetratricopeptide (TPR) repeat protein
MAAPLVRVLRHVRHPRSLPSLVWKNIKEAYDSRRPSYWNQRGTGFAASGHHEEALACFDRALALRRDIPQIWANRGRALRSLERAEEAEPDLREALRLRPDLADAHTELARVLDCLGRFDEAEACARTALRLQPEDAAAHSTLGYILYHLGRLAEAQASCRTGLRLQPEAPGWHANLGRALLLAGQLEEGWKEFGWRLQYHPHFRVRHLLGVPRWSGEAIGDRDILLVAEQGLGDALQFCRYAPQIAARARRTIFLVHPPLVKLLSRLPGGIEIITAGDQPPSADLWCPLMSLPHAVGTTLETIPATTPYLTADPADVARWCERLAGLAGLRVGLCWAGGNFKGQIDMDRRRSMTLDRLAPLGDISGVQFVSLQKGPPATEAARPPAGMELHDFTEDIDDFADTAALIENLDLVISVDTAVLHVAGALGKPVWLLNRFDTCWRWLQDRDDSPWYPSLRQFRQPAPGDWESVIGRVRHALERLAVGDRSQLTPPAADQPVATRADNSVGFPA